MSELVAVRVDRGRGHIYFLDGERCDGVTTLLGNGYPKPALVNWAANVTADYATDNWDELHELKTSERNAVLRRARYESMRAGGKRGTDVHVLVHRWISGDEIAPTEVEEPFADALELFFDEWTPEVELVETVVVHRTLRYMGTLDLVARLADGRRWLLDWKTGGKGIFPDFALQLCAYRFAEFYVNEAGQLVPMPAVDATGCVWLRDDGTYELVPVESGPSEFATFMHAKEIARFVSETSELVVGTALTPPEVK